MTTTEKAAYLKGLVEGQGLDPEAGEGKLWHVLSELVSDLAAEVKELRAGHESLADTVEEVQVGLDYLEELFQEDYDDYESFDDGDEDDDEDFSFGQGSFRIVDDEDEEEPENGEEPDDGIYYEVECPNCGEKISFSDETLEKGSTVCPNCGASLEFDLRDPDEDDGAKDGLKPETEEDGD